MPPLTPAQEARAQAWAAVFADGPAATAVLDDMVGFARTLPEPLLRAGATELVLYVLSQRTALRRRSRSNGKGGHRAP